MGSNMMISVRRRASRTCAYASNPPALRHAAVAVMVAMPNVAAGVGRWGALNRDCGRWSDALMTFVAVGVKLVKGRRVGPSTLASGAFVGAGRRNPTASAMLAGDPKPGNTYARWT
jgi:hypothetical protein